MALGFRIDNHLQCRDGLRRQVIAHIAVLKWCRVQILQALFARLYISFLAYFFNASEITPFIKAPGQIFLHRERRPS